MLEVYFLRGHPSTALTAYPNNKTESSEGKYFDFDRTDKTKAFDKSSVISGHEIAVHVKFEKT
jgi:hypothetical protein